MTPHQLRKDILDLVDWAIEDGVPLWEIYGVVSAVEKMVETVYKGSLLAGLEIDSEISTDKTI